MFQAEETVDAKDLRLELASAGGAGQRPVWLELVGKLWGGKRNDTTAYEVVLSP